MFFVLCSICNTTVKSIIFRFKSNSDADYINFVMNLVHLAFDRWFKNHGGLFDTR